jgi:uncharacterized membrane protein YphA (DoxX/SURF4 family)
LVDGKFQPLQESQLHERVRESERNTPKLAVAGTGVILLLGGLSVLLGVCPVVGIIVLIVFLLVLLGVSFQIHSFWKVDDAQMKQIDTARLGGIRALSI